MESEQGTDVYYSTLKKEYDFLRKKYSLKPLDVHLWKFMRLRPVAFPTIRISQLANLVYNSSSLFSRIIESKTTREIIEMFNISSSKFWNEHYVFGKTSKVKTKKLGKNAIEVILINAIVPFLFVHGKQKGNDEFCERSLKFLDQLSPEKNAITDRWKLLNFKNDSAFKSQALLELKNEYCNLKKCLRCGIGTYLLH